MFTLAEIVELAAGVGLAIGLLIGGEDADLAADGDGSVLNQSSSSHPPTKLYFIYLVITSDHDDANTGFVTGLDGGLDFGTWGIEHTSNADEGNV